MIIKVLKEAGYEEAMLGLSLNYNKPVETSPKAAAKLYNKDYGTNKFLGSALNAQLILWSAVIFKASSSAERLLI